MQKHQIDWGNKVRIAGLNCNFYLSKEEVEKTIKEENLGLLEHFYFGEWNSERNLWKNYGFFCTNTYTPLVVLADSDGCVEYRGNPEEIDLEQKLIQLAKLEALSLEAMKKKARLFSELLGRKAMELLNSEDFSSLQYGLYISWQQFKVYDEKGQIKGRKLTNPKLYLNYLIKEAAKMKKFEDALFGFMGGSIVLEKELEIFNPKEGIELWADVLRTELAKNQLQEAHISFYHRQRFNFKNGALDFEERRNFSHENKINPQKIAQVKTFTENLTEAHSKFNKYQKYIEPYDGFSYYDSNRPISLDFKLGKGDIFVGVQAENVHTGEKNVLKHKENEIMFIDYIRKSWTGWNEADFKTFDETEAIFKKNNEKWQQKVKLVGLSFGVEKEELSQLIAEKKWNVAEFFIGEDEKLFDQVYDYAYSWPKLLLVDQKGKMSILEDRQSLESEIQTLVDGNLEEEKNEDKKVDLLAVTKEEAKKLKDLLKCPKFNKEIEVLGRNVSFEFTVLLQKEAKFKDQMKIEEVKYHHPEFSLSIRKSDLQKIEPILGQIYSAVPQQKMKEKITLVKTIELKLGDECHECKEKLPPLSPQYYCHFCKLWLCAKCGDTIDETKNGNERLLHPHNLVWIQVSNEEGLKEIDEYKLGENQCFSENCQEFHAICNVCLKNIQGCFRYICLNCRPGPVKKQKIFEEGRFGFVDFCQQCMEVVKEKKPEEKYKDILGSLEKEKHDEKSHVWLRICFGKEYYEY